MPVVMVAMERHDMTIEKTVEKLSFVAPRRSSIWMSAVGMDSTTISTVLQASNSLGGGIHRRADVRLAVEDAPRVDERLDAGDDEEDLEHEPSFAVVPVDDDDDEDLEGHAEHHQREKRGGEAGLAVAVVDRDAEDVGAHVHHADAGGQVEPEILSALRGEEGAEASDHGEKAGASCPRHLKHTVVSVLRENLKLTYEKGKEAKGGIYSTVHHFRRKRAPP
jgi:hypothetical protein